MSPVKNPQGPEKGENRVARGGSWPTNARYCRAANRDWMPNETYTNLGFRIVFVPPRKGGP